MDVNDKKTEVLLAVIILLGSIFGWLIRSDIRDIKYSTRTMADSITDIKVNNGQTTVEIRGLRADVNKLDARVTNLEKL